ncbi:hypothetical protein Y025_5673 [Burkholderia pseudomallei TSV32]|nr:hypothetical protein Y025_5673 [Burkholderia pseudomallei TSV32]
MTHKPVLHPPSSARFAPSVDRIRPPFEPASNPLQTYLAPASPRIVRRNRSPRHRAAQTPPTPAAPQPPYASTISTRAITAPAPTASPNTRSACSSRLVRLCSTRICRIRSSLIARGASWCEMSA